MTITNQNGNTPLDWAALLGHYTIVAKFLRNGEVPLKNEKVYKPLHVACQKGHKKVCELLLLSYPKLYLNPEEGSKLLRWSVTAHHVKLGKLLVRHGAPMNLQTAVLIGDIPYLEDFIRHHGINWIDPELGQTLVQYIIKWGDRGSTNLLNFILRYEPNLEGNEREPRSALEIAASYGKKEHVKVLLNHKNVINTDAALDNAVSYGSAEIVDLLLEHSKGPIREETIFAATRKKHVRILSSLLKTGGNPFICNKQHEPLLHVAVATGQLEIVKVVVSGFVNFQNKKNESCKQLACSNVAIQDFFSSLED
eukprot:TRINITY_DN11494_c0_g2_i3.p1 TRINITY_DN11494_c0_g2~~TRINITY_DN11494_c0_g2_i3.p1  ORF type:complete len:309 (+),score=77.51 TRINITY_DN11494_c0_g2_i3:71-997(+)